MTLENDDEAKAGATEKPLSTGTPGERVPSRTEANPPPQTSRITYFDYCPEQFEFHEVADLDAFIKEHRPTWSQVRWINVDGLGRKDAVEALAQKYQLHPLAVEDVFSSFQRPKAEDYPGADDAPGRLFLVCRLLRLENEHVHGEQVSYFLGRHTLLTFQEEPDGDIFEPIRRRIETKASRIRENDASFLLYALIDAVVDQFFPLLEFYSDALEDIEEALLAKPDQSIIRRIHAIKREFVLLRRVAWPLREMISYLLREHHECLSETARTYFRDVYDHCVQIIDLIETYRDIAGNLTETYMSAISNRMNEIMKVLTIISTIFIPLTFLAGVYGMNFRKNFPELDFEYAYPTFWVVCIVMAASMLYWFRRRGWI